MTAHILVDGTATVYRLYDVGYSTDLEHAAQLLDATSPSRLRPARDDARPIHIRNPPLQATLGARTLTLGGKTHLVRLSVNLFDFGVCSLQLRVIAPAGSSWSEFSEFGRAVDAATDVDEL